MRQNKAVSLAVMGGSFDPIHLGHLIIAEQAAEALRADRVLFVPCSIPPHKDAAGLTPGPHRLKMIALATRGNPKFRASDIELARGGMSYTVDTIEQLRGMYGPRAKIWFVIGADSLKELASWKNYRRILDRCTIVTAGRPGSCLETWRGEGDAFSREEVARLRARILPTPLIGISSSEIRLRRREGLSIRYLVPAVVERYIVGHGLYRGSRRGTRVKCRAFR